MISFIPHLHFSIRNSVDFLRPLRHSHLSIRTLVGEPLRHSHFGIRISSCLVSILKQLHDDLDAAVAEAYGWPANLTDEKILTRLVALNHERAEEEKRGLIRWLRPEYQAKGQETAGDGRQEAEQGELTGVAASSSRQKSKDKGQKTGADWPKTLPGQIAAVRSALETLSGPADATAIAKLFKGARKDRIEMLLETLQALGHAHEVEGNRYSA